MKTWLLSILFLFSFQKIYAQLEISVGDTIRFGKCSGEKSFRYVDFFTKTRIPDSTLKYDEETGSGFYNYFFRGDIDGRRMSCEYNNGTAIVIGSKVFTDKETGAQRLVIFAWINRKKLQVAWIEAENALNAGEIKL